MFDICIHVWRYMGGRVCVRIQKNDKFWTERIFSYSVHVSGEGGEWWRGYAFVSVMHNWTHVHPPWAFLTHTPCLAYVRRSTSSAPRTLSKVASGQWHPVWPRKQGTAYIQFYQYIYTKYTYNWSALQTCIADICTKQVRPGIGQSVSRSHMT